MILRCRHASIVRFTGIAASLALITGCQTYDPKPLDLRLHSQHWYERTPSSEDVEKFVLRLKDADSSQGDSFDPSDGLTLKEGEVVSLVFNPDLRTARLRAKIYEAKAPFAGLWQDPTYNLNILKITETIPDPWYISSSLSLTIPISGRLKAEKSLAAAEVVAQWQQVAETEWNVIRNLRESWLSWSALKLKKDQTEEIVHQLEQIVETTQLLADAGELLKTESLLFVIERDSRRAELDQLIAVLSESEQNVRSLLGLSPAAPLELHPAKNIQAGNFEDALSADRSPTLVRLQRDYEVAENVLLREIRKQYPDLTIGPQAETDAGQSRIGFVGGIPLPIINSNKGGIAEAKAKRELSQAAYETAFERLAGKLNALHARITGIESRRRMMETTIVPMIDQQVSDAYRLLELGEGGVLVLLESLVRAFEMKLKLIDTQLEADLTYNEIQFIVGPSPIENRFTPIY
jgi:outer membrane protein, heavy metal efflux system